MSHFNFKGGNENNFEKEMVPLDPLKPKWLMITFYQCFSQAVASMHVLYFLHHAPQNILRSRIIDRFVNNSLLSGER